MVYSVPGVTTTVIRPPVAQGQDVTVFRIVTGMIVHDLPALGITAHEQHMEFRAADIFQVEGGKVCRTLGNRRYRAAHPDRRGRWTA